MKYKFVTEDHPAANGRAPKEGENSYELRFPIEGDRELLLACGELTWKTLVEAVGKFIVEKAEA